jgi:hypothetical protein
VDTWAECVDSLYGFLLIRGRVAVATSSWWQLDPEEKKLLALTVTVQGTCTACDIPVFLPCKSPAVSMYCFLMTVIGMQCSHKIYSFSVFQDISFSLLNRHETRNACNEL